MNGANSAEGSPSSTSTLTPLDWKFGQVFGERAAGEEVQEVDIISAIEFDRTGENLATGDRGGRVVLFERVDNKDSRSRKELEKLDSSFQRQIEYRYSTEFQSHEPEFDYLKSLEIEEKINKIRWCQISAGSRFLLSTNDKTIKLWKVFERKTKCVTNFNVSSLRSSNTFTDPHSFNPNSSQNSNARVNSVGNGSLPTNPASTNERNFDTQFDFPKEGIPSLVLPTVTVMNEINLLARCRRIYSNAHAYHINSISVNSDCETFISADDLRINLWNFEVSDQSFNIIDMKPTNMEDLTEVITCAEFHPLECNLLAYSSSKGSVRLIDMRQSALCDQHSKIFEEQESPGTRSFFSEIIASISDIKFSRSGQYILARDYMSLKLWDIRNENQPVSVFKVHEQLRSKLCDLYENDSIFDKFECCLSNDGARVATGSYSNLFRVFGSSPGSEEATTLEASKTPNRRMLQSAAAKSGNRFVNLARGRRDSNDASASESNGMTYDFSSKLLHLAWHPQANVIACAASNSLYMYYA